jgi:hypothetical protein
MPKLSAHQDINFQFLLLFLNPTDAEFRFLFPNMRCILFKKQSNICKEGHFVPVLCSWLQLPTTALYT